MIPPSRHLTPSLVNRAGERVHKMKQGRYHFDHMHTLPPSGTSVEHCGTSSYSMMMRNIQQKYRQVTPEGAQLLFCFCSAKGFHTEVRANSQDYEDSTQL